MTPADHGDEADTRKPEPTGVSRRNWLKLAVGGGAGLALGDALDVTAVRAAPDGKLFFEELPFTPNTPTALVESGRSVPLPSGERGTPSLDEKALVVYVPRSKEKAARLAAFDLTARAADKPVWEVVFKTALYRPVHVRYECTCMYQKPSSRVSATMQ